jgi:hypothetical protein
LSVTSTAPEAKGKRSCRSQLTDCYKACDGHVRDDFKSACDSRCRNAFNQCLHDQTYHPQGKANDLKPKKGFESTPSTGTWVPNSPKKGFDGTPSTGQWVPNSSAKGNGVPSVPAGGTWNPSPSSGAKGPLLRSSGGRR